MPGFFVGDRADLIFPRFYGHRIVLNKLSWQIGDMPNNEALIFLISLVKSGFGPVVEFGTFRGRTTYNLALNTFDEIVTIDNGSLSSAGAAAPDFEYADATIGSCYKNEVFAGRINQITCDSRELDTAPFEGKVGLVIVDGGHERDIVQSDSEKALRMIRKNGVVVWDDCNDSWPGVFETVQGLARERNMLFLHREGLVVTGSIVDSAIERKLVRQ